MVRAMSEARAKTHLPAVRSPIQQAWGREQASFRAIFANVIAPSSPPHVAASLPQALPPQPHSSSAGLAAGAAA